MTPHHAMDAGAVLAALDSGREGLTSAEVARRLATHGPNALAERGVKSPWLILYEQVSGPLVVLLIIAAVVSALLHEYLDAIAIGIIVVLNAALGVSQEYRAEQAMAALKKLAVPTVRVRRGGVTSEISARELVPGDLVLLETGHLVPADCRLLEAVNLRVQEAALTGESEPVEKQTDALTSPELPLGDRRNLAYMGTTVTYGRGLGVVTATGMATELGSIATLIQAVVREPTPLQRRLGELGRTLALVALALVAVIFGQGLARGGLGLENVKLMFLTAVSMAVAAVPEGLPAVVTIALALGAQRMLRRQALVRKLLAVETLGAVTVICSDKTGTLTANRMTVTVLAAGGPPVRLEAWLAGAPEPAGAWLLAGAALCNDSELQPDAGVVGDPTEAALVSAAALAGLPKDALGAVLPRVAEVPFDSERKRMTTVHAWDGAALPSVLPAAALGLAPGALVAWTKGAADGLLEVSSHVWTADGPGALDEPRRAALVAANDALAGAGVRVLGVAWRALDALPARVDAGLETDLVFLGLVGLIDPPRPEVQAAVETCRHAGIRPVMITGDHPLTARAIAAELGLNGGGRVVTGSELAALNDEQLAALVPEVAVYARVAPEHKLRIVAALQAHGQVVAMTGDGVNDSPALKKADIGVAMGITGTDVAKEAADMVLRDDNFATIVAAVEEGRVIYDNIRKFIQYLLATNSGEIFTMLCAPLLGLPLPLLPLQILWVNLVTDGLPALALAVEPAEQGTMRRPPRRPQESFFAGHLGAHILWVGCLMAALALGGAAGCWRAGADEAHFRSLVFTLVTLTQMAHVLAIHTGLEPFVRAGLRNPPLLGAVALTCALQVALIYVPALQRWFGTEPLTARELGAAVLISSLLLWAVEIEKWVLRRRANGLRPR